MSFLARGPNGTVVCMQCRTLAVQFSPGRWRCDLCAKPGLGDMFAAGLAAVGITKERVSAVLGKPCGCAKRQAAANRLGHKYLGLPPGQS